MLVLETYLAYFILAAVGIAFLAGGYMISKFEKPGAPPLVPPFYLHLTGLIILLVLAAELVALLTGVRWSSPFAR